MTISNLAIALSVIFAVSIVALAGELLYVLWRHRSFRRQSSPPPNIRSRDETPNFSIADASTKELQYFFCLKPHTPVELVPPGASNKEQLVDVFKLLEAKRPSRFKEEVESKSDVDFSNKPAIDEVKEVVAVKVDLDDENTKTVFSTPYDSPEFLTPVGSPARDFMESEFVVSVDIGNSNDHS